MTVDIHHNTFIKINQIKAEAMQVSGGQKSEGQCTMGWRYPSTDTTNVLSTPKGSGVGGKEWNGCHQLAV